MTIDIQRLKSGDDAAFRECVESYKDRVFSTIYNFVRNRDDIEDIAQEVFIEIHRSVRNFREDAELSTWIYRIAVNKSLDFLRKQKRKKRKGFLQSIGIGRDDEPDIDIPDYSTPADHLEMKERKELLQWALNRLPENQRTVITLSRYQGFSNGEISEVMKLSLPAVESLVYRAKKNLRRFL